MLDALRGRIISMGLLASAPGRGSAFHVELDRAS